MGQPLNFVLINAVICAEWLGGMTGVMLAWYGPPKVNVTFWLWVALAGCIQFTGLTHAAAAFSRSKLSRLVPLNALLPLVQVVLGWLWRGEWFTTIQLLGMAAVIGGLLVNALLIKRRGDDTEPVATATNEHNSRWLRWFWWIQASPGRQYAIALSTWPLYSFALKPALESVKPSTPVVPFMASAMVMGVMAVLGCIMCFFILRAQEAAKIKEQGDSRNKNTSMQTAANVMWIVRWQLGAKDTRRLFKFSSAIVTIQQYGDLKAYTTGKIGAVASMLEMGIVFNVISLWVIGKLEKRRDPNAEPEKVTPRLAIVAVVVTVGAMMIGGFGK